MARPQPTVFPTYSRTGQTKADTMTVDDSTPTPDHQAGDEPDVQLLRPDKVLAADQTTTGDEPDPTFQRRAAGSIILFLVLAAGLFTLARLSNPTIPTSSDTEGAEPQELLAEPNSTTVAVPSSVESPPAELGTTSEPETESTPTVVHRQSGPVWDVVVLTDGRLAAATGTEVAIWDPFGAAESTSAFGGHSSPVQNLAVLADGRVASSDGDGVVQLWDPDDLDRPAIVFDGHGGLIRDLVELADGRIASAGVDDGLLFWSPDDPGRAEQRTGPAGELWSMEVLASGELALGSSDLVHVVDPDDAAGSAKTLTGHEGVVVDLIELDDGRLLTAGLDSTVMLWDTERADRDPEMYRGHSSPVQALVALPDGRVASGGTGLVIHVWDPAVVEAEPLVLRGHDDAVTALTVLPDGRLVSASADGTVRLWTIEPF